MVCRQSVSTPLSITPNHEDKLQRGEIPESQVSLLSDVISQRFSVAAVCAHLADCLCKQRLGVPPKAPS